MSIYANASAKKIYIYIYSLLATHDVASCVKFNATWVLCCAGAVMGFGDVCDVYVCDVGGGWMVLVVVHSILEFCGGCRLHFRPRIANHWRKCEVVGYVVVYGACIWEHKQQGVLEEVDINLEGIKKMDIFRFTSTSMKTKCYL